jgi:NTP pyrophosphatase (non-canonical NTP hydrolase)
MLTEEMKTKIAATPFTAMVAALIKPGKDIISELSPGRANALHMAVGASGESGELLDAIKKYVIYGKPLDRANVVEELGDLEFYMEGLRAELDISREETLEANKLKLLGKRYASGKYSDAQAIARADKAAE